MGAFELKRKSLLSQLLIGALVFQAGYVEQTAPVAAADTGVVINEVGPDAGNEEFIELYNASDVAVSLAGWWLESDSGGQIAVLSGELPARALHTIDSEDVLDDDIDHVWLKNQSGAVVDSLSYGMTGWSQTPAADHSMSIARTTNGATTWVANVEPTPNENNITPPSVVPTGLTLPGGQQHPGNTVNRATERAVVAEVVLPQNVEDALIALFDTDGEAVSETTDELPAGTHQIELNTRMLADGTLRLRAYTEDADEVRSQWFNASEVTKDTIAPSEPNVTEPIVPFISNSNTIVIRGTAGPQDTIRAFHNEEQLATVLAQPAFELSLPLVPDTTQTFHLLAEDQVGNQSSRVALPAITQDGTAPNPVVQLMGAALAGGIVELEWNRSTSDDVRSYAVYTDNRSGTLQTEPLATVDDPTHRLQTARLSTGTYRFAVRALDTAGNLSALSDTIMVFVPAPSTTIGLNNGQQSIDERPEFPVRLETGASTLAGGAVTITDYGRENPQPVPVTGAVAVGSYVDVSSTNATIFPLKVEIFYTQADLEAANIRSETQLRGLAYFDTDSGQWRFLSTSTVNTVDQTVQGTSYQGSFTVTVTHLTTFIGVADVTAPLQPINLRAKAGDHRVKLSWQAVPDAAGYFVRYKKATAAQFTTIFVSGGSNTQITIDQLENGVAYEFGVATEDAQGNVSDYVTIQQTPGSTVVQAESTTTPKTTATFATTDTNTTTSSGNPPTTPPPAGGATPEDVADDTTDREGDIKGDQQTQAPENSRSFVTLLIILVAAAAGFGGWYGYQWWVTRDDGGDTDIQERTPAAAPPPEPKKQQSKKTERSGRW